MNTMMKKIFFGLLWIVCVPAMMAQNTTESYYMMRAKEAVQSDDYDTAIE